MRPELSNLLIRASAGTGKTFQLSHRYLALLYRGVPPEQILATTFTRKAAAEILDRIVTRLAAAALDDDERAELENFLGAQSFARSECLTMLRSLLRNLHRLRISTLDSLFAQIARTFSLELGLPPAWRIVDDPQEMAVREAAIDAVLRREETGKLLALTHLLTKGEAVRGVGELIRDTVAKLHGLFQETSPEAWHSIPRHKQLDPAELASLIDQLQQLPLADKRMQTARNEDCERALKGDWETFLEKGLAAKVLRGENTYHSKPIPPDAIDLYLRLLDQVRVVLVNRVVLQTEGSYALLQSFDTERRRWQVENAGLRFDDITLALDTALRGPPASPNDNELRPGEARVLAQPDERGFAHRLDGAVSHLLLDEFQDTSPRQWRALRPLVARATGSDGHSSFFCVGDVKQAIYGWRGGVAEIFDAIEGQVPQLQPQPLTHSYRSSRAVIELVNLVFQNACQHPRLERAAPAVKAWCARFQEHTTQHADRAGYACLRTAAAASDDQEPQQNVLLSTVELVADLYREAPAYEIGVLVRTNDTVGRLIHLLRQRNLPASEEGGNPLIDSAAVQIVLSLLRLADHPGDLVARFHVATSPIGTAVGLTGHDDNRGARRLAAEIRRELQSYGHGHFVRRVAELLRSYCDRRDRTRLEQLIEQAYSYQPRATLRTDDFVRQVQCERIAEPTRAPIRVMTIHQAKGLEFDTVVLPELDVDLAGQPPAVVVERLDPLAPVSCVCRYVNVHLRLLMQDRIQKMFEAATDREVSESLCVLYVALTRAIHALHIIISPSKPKENSFPRTLAGILRTALAGTGEARPDSVLFAGGDPHWYRSLPSRSEVPAPGAVLTEPAVIKLAPSDQRRRGLQRISPSGLEGGTRVRIRRWLEADADAAALRGTVLHACFQHIQWADEDLPGDELLRGVITEALRCEGRTGDASVWLDEFHRLLAKPEIQAQLRREAYRQPEWLGFSAAASRQLRKHPFQLTVETERPFAAGDSRGLIAGSIDRVVWLHDQDKVLAADIIDFKTDLLPADNEAVIRERVDFYSPQIAAYRSALSKMTGLPPEMIAGRLLFVSAGLAVVVT